MLTLKILSPGASGLEKTSRNLPCTLDTLFEDVQQAPTSQNCDQVTKLMLEASYDHKSIPLMLWAARTSDLDTLYSNASVEDAVEAATDFLNSVFQSDCHAQNSIVLGFEADRQVDSKDDMSAITSSSYVVVLSIINTALLRTHSISLRARQDLEERRLLEDFSVTPKPVTAWGRFTKAILPRGKARGGSSPYSFLGAAPPAKTRSRRSRMLFLLLSLVLAVCLSAASLSAFLSFSSYRITKYHRPAQDNFFQAANWSEWSSAHDLNEWHLRSDIGALVPSTQYDAEELPRLKWIEQEVPELARLFGNGRYPPPEDYGTIIPTGEGYHFAHCALTLRRFYWAHKRGWGLCPKDFDDEHLVHCLDVVDAHAFTVNGTAVIPTPKSTIHWFSPMACF